MKKTQLKYLPWPALPLLKATQICSYYESQPRRQALPSLLATAFPDTPLGREMRDQFSHILMGVIHKYCDPRDRKSIVFTDVPSQSANGQTKAPYSAAEVAAWWNESVEIVNALAGNS